MPSLLIIALAAVWLVGTWLRIYQLARFYQIEEYMSRRFFLWLRRAPRHLLPKRALGAWFLGAAIAVVLGEAPNSALPLLIMIVAALVAVSPQQEQEIKRPLVRTGRVKRMLAAAAISAALAGGASSVLAVNAFEELETLRISSMAIAASGFILFLLAPIWLTLGNLILQPFESYRRRRYLSRARSVLNATKPKIIGITGSYGKTTTKDFLRDILSLRYRAYATPKSYNTLMGISLAINRDLVDDYRTEYFISEMGAYVPGEIDRICQLTPPDIAIVTEVGPQHLERFGSLENVMRAKYEIIKNLKEDGVGIFNWDNAFIREMIAKGHPKTRLSVSRELNLAEARRENLTWIATDTEESLQGLRFTVTNVASGEQARLSTSVIGEHNVTNLLLCVAVAFHEGLPLRDIAMRIGTLKPAESRLQWQRTASGITIINDAYSANPKGVVSALKVLGMHKDGKRLLITPGMIELGDLQDRENRKLGVLACEYATDIILIGREQTKPVFEGIRSAGYDMARVQVYETLAESVAWYRQHLRANDTVLFLNDLPDTY
ncbi:MAG: UDP-N-acetylmuramoyl-tripeptide--D-alanyl-D-alanine ligase [Chloroflexota bacterium]|nr:UDP-N-acetylmuramoyl-tripeptide--D-alanyl-D-alanine ligase [Chloroflexota bacterium]MDE2952205.1 UDP-N-acetylmuramoyl-tripeptide--D-alanyl-D-alanine ligase [Chloroflexota bacterium]